MAYNVPKIMTIETLNAIDGTQEGSVRIFTTTERFVPFYAFLEVVESEGFSVMSQSIISIGTNASLYNNILSDSMLENFHQVNNVLTFPFFTISRSVLNSVDPYTGIYLNMVNPAIANTFVFKCSIVGFYS